MGKTLVEPDISGANAAPRFSLILDATADDCDCTDIVPCSGQAASTAGRKSGNGRIDLHRRNIGRGP